MLVENSKMIYRGSDELAKVYRGDTVVWERDRDYSLEYLTFKNVGNSDGIFNYGCVYSTSPVYLDIEISKNSGPWVHYSAATSEYKTLSRGEIMKVRGNNNSYNGDGYFSVMGVSGNTNSHVFGNIMSLIHGDDFVGKTTLGSENKDCFAGLFYGYNTGYKLTSAKNLILPATVLSYHCYGGLFQYCPYLQDAPQLPATTLAYDCYNSMFRGCTSLASAPELPATTLAARCYRSMFEGCTSLTSAPELPATTLADYCYYSMFYGCTGLTSAHELPATTLAENCYRYMFYGCSSLAEAPELPDRKSTRLNSSHPAKSRMPSSA